MKSICISCTIIQNIVQLLVVTKTQLYEWLSKQGVYTSHHPIIHHFARRRVVTRGLNDVWDVDLMDMSNLAKYNDGVLLISFQDISMWNQKTKQPKKH